MLRYVRGEIAGRAYLIAGHRGCGKSTLAYSAVERVLALAVDEKLPVRPLLVRLNGPDLLRADPDEVKEAMTAKNADDVASPAAGASHELVPAVHVLTQITIGLYKAIVEEVNVFFRRRVESAPLHRRVELRELAAQLRLEFDDLPGEARLRQIWERAGVLHGGVLFDEPREDQGFRELVALSSASQAFQVVSFRGDDARTETADAKADAAVQRGAAPAQRAKDVSNAVVSLLAGGAVGAGALPLGPFPAAVVGAVTALGSLIGLDYTLTRSQSRTSNRKTSFIKDRSPSTLSRMLPDLVRRLREAGLAPIFIVDELDKLTALEQVLVGLVERLKHFVTERSFFCFLTDRTYFEQLAQESRTTPYPLAYTYFSDRLLVVYRPGELHQYLENLIVPDSNDSAAEVDAVILRYILLHRARLHPFDLRRQVESACDATGRMFVVSADLRSKPRYRFDVQIQVTAEWLLEQDELCDRCAQDPDFLHYAYDALYYVSRVWQSGATELDVTELPFRKYLETRFARRAGDAAADVTLSIPPQDIEFLRLQAWKMTGCLTDPEGLKNQLATTAVNLPQPILDMLPGADLALLVVMSDGKYRFRHDFHGRSLMDKELEEFLSDEFEGDHQLIGTFRDALALLTIRIDPGTLAAEYHVLPTSPAWTNVQRAWRIASDVVTERQLANPARQRTTADATEAFGTVREYAKLVRASLPAVALALYCGRVLGMLDTGNRAISSLPEGLRLIDRELRLASLSITETTARLRKIAPDLGRLVPGLPMIDPADPIFSTDILTWGKRANDLLAAVDTADPLGRLADESLLATWSTAAWAAWKARFAAHQAPPVAMEREAAELLCAAAKVRRGPGDVLGPLDDMTLRDWSLALYRSIESGDPADAPRWLVIPAVARLGFRGLLEPLAEKLLGMSSLSGLPLTHDEWVNVGRCLDWIVPADAKQATPGRRVLVVPAVDRSITDAWKPEQEHSALVLSPQEIATLAKDFAELDLDFATQFGFDVTILEVPANESPSARKAVALKCPPPLPDIIGKAERVYALTEQTTTAVQVGSDESWTVRPENLAQALRPLLTRSSSPTGT